MTPAATPVTPSVMLLDPLSLKPRRESASQIDEFFEEAVEGDGGSRLMERFSALVAQASGPVRPAAGSESWDDITTSLSKIDPDNAEMLELECSRMNQAVKIEPVDQELQHVSAQPNSTIATGSNRMQRFNYSNGFLPPTPPSSDPGSPSQQLDSNVSQRIKPPPPPYSAAPPQHKTSSTKSAAPSGSADKPSKTKIVFYSPRIAA